MPKRIIILRHGEKQEDPYRLCSVGLLRAEALVTKYLGKGAKDSLFAGGPDPAAFFAITMHTLALAGPAAASWGLPVQMYAALPNDDVKTHDDDLDQRTREAAEDAFDLALKDATIVMVWEHKRIASKDQLVTLRKLLNLDTLAAPEKWQGENYDFFWVVEYADDGNPRTPTKFCTIKQKFDVPFDDVPSNDWGMTVILPPDCEQHGTDAGQDAPG